jgi:hypothetical protein
VCFNQGGVREHKNGLLIPDYESDEFAKNSLMKRIDDSDFYAGWSTEDD